MKVSDIREEAFVRAMNRLKGLLDRMDRASDEEYPALRGEAVKELEALLGIGRQSAMTDERMLALVEACLVEAAKEELADRASA